MLRDRLRLFDEFFRFGKKVSNKENTRNEQYDNGGFSFGNSSKKKELDKQRLQNFFGNENNETNISSNKGTNTQKKALQ